MNSIESSMFDKLDKSFNKLQETIDDLIISNRNRLLEVNSLKDQNIALLRKLKELENQIMYKDKEIEDLNIDLHLCEGHLPKDDEL